MSQEPEWRSLFDTERDRRFQEQIDGVRREIGLLHQASLREIDTRHADTLREIDIKAQELARRLSELNGAHEQARRKEVEFLPRELYESHVQRTIDDFKALRQEIRNVADAYQVNLLAREKALSDAWEAKYKSLLATMNEKDKEVDGRVGRVENLQAKLIGGGIAAMIIMPFLPDLVRALLNRK